MTLQALVYFVTVARRKSYSQAAKECFVSQPALSRAVQALEEELGCRLFDRSTRVVMLTPEGEACLREAEEVLAACARLRACAANGGAYQLRVGYMFSGYIYELNRQLDAAPEKIRLMPCYDTYPRLKGRLLSGELDAILIPELEKADIAGTECSYLVRSGLYVMFPIGHALEKREHIYLADLKGNRLIGWSEEDLPGVNAAHRAACRSRGFEPEYLAFASKVGDAAVLARQYDAAVLVAKTLAGAVPEGICARPVEDSDQCYGIVCVWKKDRLNPALAVLRRLGSREVEKRVDL